MNRLRRPVVAFTVMCVAAVAALGACGNDETSGSTETTGDRTDTTASPAPPGFTIDPAVPDDPAGLPACDSIDAPGDLRLPTRWLSASVPDSVDIGMAGTTVRAEATPTDGSGLWVMIATEDSAGSDEVAAEVVLEVAPLGDRDVPAGFEPTATVRGVDAELGSPDDGSGPPGVVAARWVEGGRVWTAAAAGLDEAELAAVTGRLALDGPDPTDPAGSLAVIASAPGRFAATRTEVGLSASGVSPREYGLVVEEHLGGEGLPVVTGLVPRTGLVLGELDGRPALRGALGGVQVLMATTADGAAVYAYGELDADELDELVASLERVTPDDPRLVGVPMDFTATGLRFCRDDR